MAVLAAGALVWGLAAGPALADNIRDQQWALQAYKAATDVWPISQGDGVTVAVIDTGVYSDQQDLTGQVLPGADFSGAQTDGRVDNDGHGTGMASIIAGHGHGDQAGVMGLAPKAKILPVRVGLQDSGDMQGARTSSSQMRSAMQSIMGRRLSTCRSPRRCAPAQMIEPL